MRAELQGEEETWRGLRECFRKSYSKQPFPPSSSARLLALVPQRPKTSVFSSPAEGSQHQPRRPLHQCGGQQHIRRLERLPKGGRISRRGCQCEGRVLGQRGGEQIEQELLSSLRRRRGSHLDPAVRKAVLLRAQGHLELQLGGGSRLPIARGRLKEGRDLWRASYSLQSHRCRQAW